MFLSWGNRVPTVHILHPFLLNEGSETTACSGEPSHRQILGWIFWGKPRLSGRGMVSEWFSLFLHRRKWSMEIPGKVCFLWRGDLNCRFLSDQLTHQPQLASKGWTNSISNTRYFYVCWSMPLSLSHVKGSFPRALWSKLLPVPGKKWTQNVLIIKITRKTCFNEPCDVFQIIYPFFLPNINKGGSRAYCWYWSHSFIHCMIVGRSLCGR